ncbi:hypothetical protein IV203_018556 [Nitzschia inconspicua]|uniref:Transposase n=1 Tax=Nitzschia inconspicua TaxID=303405 RepID=A0A9K3M197_9STRA|nr:hypothetical protein IV203_018556 [Nitzschia inconspicua]
MKHVASDNFTLVERDRFIAIQSCTRGYAQAGRTASVHSNAWTQQGAMLRRMKEIEVALFERSVDALLDKENGFIVLDDELIASRAADFEQKAVSNRKRGKEGPVADCIACSMLSTCFGMRLRVKNDSSIVDLLLDSLLIPKNTECGIELAFDRGYGKLAAVLAAADRDLDVITIAGTLGSRHPFNTVEWDAAMQKRRHRSQLTPETIRGLKGICGQWLIPSDNYLGCEARVAKRQKPQSKTVYALALRDVFNRKEARKDLKFFVTQNHKPYTFVGVPKVQENKNDVLFSHTKASATRSLVEGMIRQSAERLTTGQRCADWFLMKSMLISGTMAGEIAQTVDLNTLRMSDESTVCAISPAIVPEISIDFIKNQSTHCYPNDARLGSLCRCHPTPRILTWRACGKERSVDR